MGLPKRSIARWNTSAGPPSASAISPTTTLGRGWNPAGSDQNYTLDSEEPGNASPLLCILRCKSRTHLADAHHNGRIGDKQPPNEAVPHRGPYSDMSQLSSARLK